MFTLMNDITEFSDIDKNQSEIRRANYVSVALMIWAFVKICELGYIFY